MKNSQVRGLNHGDMLVPKVGRISSNGYGVKDVDSMKFRTSEWDNWNNKYILICDEYQNGNSTGHTLKVFNDSVEFYVNDPDSFDLFDCK